MTYKDFKRQVFLIYNETFQGGDVSPIEYGIQRAHFEESKLERLILLAEQTRFSTAKRKVAGWMRQRDRVRQIRQRLESRRVEASKTARVDEMPLVPNYLERSAPVKIALRKSAPRENRPVAR